MNPPAAAKATWKIARSVASRMFCASSMTSLPGNSSSPRNWNSVPAAKFSKWGLGYSWLSVAQSKRLMNHFRGGVHGNWLQRWQDGRPQHGHHAVRTRWLPRDAHLGRGSGHRCALALHLWNDRRGTADAGGGKYHSADQPL